MTKTAAELWPCQRRTGTRGARLGLQLGRDLETSEQRAPTESNRRRPPPNSLWRFALRALREGTSRVSALGARKAQWRTQHVDPARWTRCVRVELGIVRLPTSATEEGLEATTSDLGVRHAKEQPSCLAMLWASRRSYATAPALDQTNLGPAALLWDGGREDGKVVVGCRSGQSCESSSEKRLMLRAVLRSKAGDELLLLIQGLNKAAACILLRAALILE